MTFGMAYLNGQLHVGHLMLFTTIDVARRLFHYTGYASRFENAYHATGQPIKITLDKINSGEVSEIPYLPLLKAPVTFETWADTLMVENNRVLGELRVESDLNNCFCTTDKSQIYSSFIRWQFDKLWKSGLIQKKNHPIIFCTNCNTPCGDHDRRAGEGIFLESMEYSFHKSTESAVYRLKEPKSRDLISWTVYVGGTLIECESSRKWHVKHESALPLVRSELSDTGVLLLTINSFDSDIVCRCGTLAAVGVVLDQYFIRYDDSVWKSKVEAVIRGYSHNSINNSLKKALLNRLSQMRAFPFTRTQGYGTRWSAPGDDRRLLIESLSDSCLFMILEPMYQVIQGAGFPVATVDLIWDRIFGGVPQPPDTSPLLADVVDKCIRIHADWGTSDYHTVGKDLINNHVLFTIYFHTFFCAGLACPSFKVRGHLLIDGLKMSKSTGNFLTLGDLRQKWSTNAIRLTLATVGDSLADSDLKTSDLAINQKLLKEISRKYSRPVTEIEVVPPAELARLYQTRLKLRVVQALASLELMNLRHLFIKAYYELNPRMDKTPHCIVEKYKLFQKQVINSYCPGIFQLSELEQQMVSGLVSELKAEVNIFCVISLSKYNETATESCSVLGWIEEKILKNKSPGLKCSITLIASTGHEYSLLKDKAVVEYLEHIAGVSIQVKESVEKIKK